MSDSPRGPGFVERTLQQAARRLSAAGLHPLRLRDDIIAAFDKGVHGNDAPNQLRVALNPADHARLGPELDAFRDDMQAVLTERASLRGWSTIAVLQLQFLADSSVRHGGSQIESRFVHYQHVPVSPAIHSTRRLTLVRDLRLLLPGGEVIHVRHLPFSIGRTSDNDLVLASMAVSRTHAELASAPPSVVVRDRGSFNGVVIDGQRVDEAPLADGMVLSIGDVELTVRFDAE